MSEMNLAQAVAECGKWGNLIRALSKVDEVARTIANLAQQETELKRSIEGLRTEAAAAVDARDRATADAIAIRQSAQSDATERVAEARSQAHALISAAKDEVKSLQNVANDAMESADGFLRQRATIKEEINTATAELERIRQQIEEAKAEALRRFGS